MSQRAERVAEFIKQEISVLIQRGLKDPRIGFVTVTDVEVTRDLRNAKVYISVFGDDEKKNESMKGLKTATGFIRREVGKHLRLRHIPEITFRFDESVQYGAHINELLTGINKTERLGNDDGEDECTE
ncbi:MAG: 30S ribosome-binding factor RbfA [Halanaerobiales bacterium]|nr:30S ribosome-binding factor RbfA [Halanaerobiales bacterium]